MEPSLRPVTLSVTNPYLAHVCGDVDNMAQLLWALWLRLAGSMEAYCTAVLGLAYLLGHLWLHHQHQHFPAILGQE